MERDTRWCETVGSEERQGSEAGASAHHVDRQQAREGQATEEAEDGEPGHEAQARARRRDPQTPERLGQRLRVWLAVSTAVATHDDVDVELLGGDPIDVTIRGERRPARS